MCICMCGRIQACAYIPHKYKSENNLGNRSLSSTLFGRGSRQCPSYFPHLACQASLPVILQEFLWLHLLSLCRTAGITTMCATPSRLMWILRVQTLLLTLVWQTFIHSAISPVQNILKLHFMKDLYLQCVNTTQNNNKSINNLILN